MQKTLNFGKGSGRIPFQLGQLALLTLLGYELAAVRSASVAAQKFVTDFNALADGDESVSDVLSSGAKYSDEVYTRAVVVDETGKQFRTIDVGFSTKPTYFICVDGAEYLNAQQQKVKGTTLRPASKKEMELAGIAA